MADATAVITVNGFPDAKDMTFNHYHLYGTIAITPGTYPAGGIPLNWNMREVFNPATISWAEFMSVGSPPGVYDYAWDRSNLRILTSQTAAANTGTAPFVEFTTGKQIPTPILTDVIQFHAIFRRA